MMKQFDHSDTIQSNTATMSSCAKRQYLNCGVSVVSDPSNSGVHKYHAQCFTHN